MDLARKSLALLLKEVLDSARRGFMFSETKHKATLLFSSYIVLIVKGLVKTAEKEFYEDTSDADLLRVIHLLPRLRTSESIFSFAKPY